MLLISQMPPIYWITSTHIILKSQDLEHMALQVLGMARRKVVLQMKPDYYGNKVISEIDC